MGQQHREHVCSRRHRLGERAVWLNGNRSATRSECRGDNLIKRVLGKNGTARRVQWGVAGGPKSFAAPGSFGATRRPETCFLHFGDKFQPRAYCIGAALAHYQSVRSAQMVWTSDELPTSPPFPVQGSSLPPPRNGCGWSQTPAKRWRQHRRQGPVRCRRARLNPPLPAICW